MAKRSRVLGAIAALLLAAIAPLHAQAPAPAGAAAPAQPADLFDFWVGDWDLSWTNADGSAGRGRNRISKIHDGVVIAEDFEEAAPGNGGAPLKGGSLTVFDKSSGVWRQAWADNQGSFFALSARVEGERRILVTEVRRDGDRATAQRMVFHAIRPESLTWDWEGSADGGTTWKPLWHVEYRRRATS